MNLPRMIWFVMASFACCSSGFAQEEPKGEPKPQVEVRQGASGQSPPTIAVSAVEPTSAKESNPGVAFTRLGGAVARFPVPTPKDAVSLAQFSAPLGSNGAESVVAHLYKRSDALFLDILTARGKQAMTRRNTVRLKAPYPARPGDLALTLRPLDRNKRSGLMLVASDSAMNYVLAFPKGFGGGSVQQQFLTTAKNGTQSAYTFGGLDSRGMAMVKATVISAEGGAPGSVLQYFVWNGSKFIPRAEN